MINSLSAWTSSWLRQAFISPVLGLPINSQLAGNFVEVDAHPLSRRRVENTVQGSRILGFKRICDGLHVVLNLTVDLGLLDGLLEGCE